MRGKQFREPPCNAAVTNVTATTHAARQDQEYKRCPLLPSFSARCSSGRCTGSSGWAALDHLRDQRRNPAQRKKALTAEPQRRAFAAACHRRSARRGCDSDAAGRPRRRRPDPRADRGSREDACVPMFGFERDLTERMTQARFIARQTDSFEQAAAVFAGLFKTAADQRRAPATRRYARGGRAPRGPARNIQMRGDQRASGRLSA